jgi:hypothetical protein
MDGRLKNYVIARYVHLRVLSLSNGSILRYVVFASDNCQPSGRWPRNLKPGRDLGLAADKARGFPRMTTMKLANQYQRLILKHVKLKSVVLLLAPSQCKTWGPRMNSLSSLSVA